MSQEGLIAEIEHAEKVVSHVRCLWGSETKLFTDIEDELWEI